MDRYGISGRDEEYLIDITRAKKIDRINACIIIHFLFNIR